MEHKRQKIIDKIVDILKVENIEKIGSKVYNSRTIALQEDSLPCICVYAPSESVEYISFGPGATLQRTCDVMIEVHMTGENAESESNRIACIIERTVNSDSLSSLVDRLSYESYFGEGTSTNETKVYLSRHSYIAEYFTNEGEPC